MMRGRSNFSSYFPQRQTLESRAMRILSKQTNSFYCIQTIRFTLRECRDAQAGRANTNGARSAEGGGNQARLSPNRNRSATAI